MAKWIFEGMQKGLKKYRCSNCGFMKVVCHAKFKPSRNQYGIYPFRCPKCKEIITY